MNEPVKQHVAPSSYLEQFSRDGAIWVFDRTTGEIRPQPPKTSTISRNFYTFIDNDGNNRYDIEKFLGNIEGNAKPAMGKLSSGAAITADEKEWLCWFLGFAVTRTVRFQRQVNGMHEQLATLIGDEAFGTVERAAETMKAYADIGNELGGTPEEAAAFFSERRFIVEVHRNASLDSMMTVTDKIAHAFLNMDWIVWHAPRRTSFITSDNPIALVPTQPTNHLMGIGINTPGVLKIFPLSLGAALVMYDRGQSIDHRETDQGAVRSMNFRLALNGDRWVIARDEALLTSIVQRLPRGGRS